MRSKLSLSSIWKIIFRILSGFGRVNFEIELDVEFRRQFTERDYRAPFYGDLFLVCARRVPFRAKL